MKEVITKKFIPVSLFLFIAYLVLIAIGGIIGYPATNLHLILEVVVLILGFIIIHYRLSPYLINEFFDYDDLELIKTKYHKRLRIIRIIRISVLIITAIIFLLNILFFNSIYIELIITGIILSFCCVIDDLIQSIVGD